MVEETDKSGAQKDAEAEVESFREDLGPFVVAAETTRMPMVFTDAKEPARPIIFANESFLKLTGYPREEVLAYSLTDLLARGAQAEALADVEAAFKGASDRDPEIHYRRKDGSEFWASVFVSPVRDDDGNVVQHFVSFVDLTKHKQEQSRCMLMIDELNHRVKNTLATVQSIALQALRKGSDAETIRESIESRLFALSRSHDLLTSKEWEGAGLRELLHAALEPFGVANGRAERFVITGKNVCITPKMTLALGITFNELATNAVKYGAFSNDVGTVLISWTAVRSAKGGRLVLTWQEKDGPPVKQRTRRGLARRSLNAVWRTSWRATCNWSSRRRASSARSTSPRRWPPTMHKILEGRRVLVLEDEMMVLFVIEDMLGDLGCEAVTTAATVNQALALIEERSFDAAILDVNLNGQQSYPVADALAARGVPFAFATGYGAHGMKVGYSDRPVLQKPFREGDLFATIARLFPTFSRP